MGLHYLHNGPHHPVHNGPHHRPIYHLDLNPTNILLDRYMMPKIGGFGLSRIFASLTTKNIPGETR
jgi:serine/threonine protein kinase